MIAEATGSIGRFFSRRLRTILRCVAVAILVPSLLAPVLMSAGPEICARAVYRFEAALCHQVPERCFRIGGEPFALCARCLGAYFGFLLVSFIFSVKFDPGRGVRSGIAVAAVAGLLDICLHMIGLYDSGNAYRLVSGLFVGSGLGMVVFRFISRVENSEPD